MGELPLDRYEKILVRLKTKDLLRSKSVCKSWYSLISGRRFVDSHQNYILKKQADNNENGNTRIVMTGPSRNDTCQIVGSANGLVCLRFYTDQFLVVNPSTHQLIKLKTPHQNNVFPCMGFGYDSSIHDYKVVIGFRNTCTEKYNFLVLTLKTNVWKSVAVELDYNYMFPKGFLCNGAIHRLATDLNNNPILVSFDLSKDAFKETRTPKALHAYDFLSEKYKLGTIKDCLCIFRGRSRTSSNQRELWLMKNYNAKKSKSIWKQMLSPPHCDDSGHERVVNYIPRKSFSGHIHIWMLEEDSCAPVFVQNVESCYGKDHNIWLTAISGGNYEYDEHVFVESLVSPHGMGINNGIVMRGE